MKKTNKNYFVFSWKKSTSNSWKNDLSWYLSLALGILSIIWVLLIRNSDIYIIDYLTTIYSVDVIRWIILHFIVLGIVLWSLSFLYHKNKFSASVGMILSISAFVLGGDSDASWSSWEVLNLWVDWFVISLLVYGSVFMLIEKAFPLREEQPILREEWSLDMKYYLVNHLAWWIFLIWINHVIQNYLWFIVSDDLQWLFGGMNIVLQLILVFIIADFIQYWVHRAYHEVPFLWKFHVVHHSAPKMDWLAWSRLHIFELFGTRSLILISLVLLWFSEFALNVYIIAINLWVTFIHLNINVNIPYVEKLLVWPKFHHWHHSSDKKAMNKNYASQFSIYDIIFKTAYFEEKYPKHYGVANNKLYPKTLLEQTFFPFYGDK